MLPAATHSKLGVYLPRSVASVTLNFNYPPRLLPPTVCFPLPWPSTSLLPERHPDHSGVVLFFSLSPTVHCLLCFCARQRLVSLSLPTFFGVTFARLASWTSVHCEEGIIATDPACRPWHATTMNEVQQCNASLIYIRVEVGWSFECFYAIFPRNLTVTPISMTAT